MKTDKIKKVLAWIAWTISGVVAFFAAVSGLFEGLFGILFIIVYSSHAAVLVLAAHKIMEIEGDA
jgi:hypothetical protein